MAHITCFHQRKGHQQVKDLCYIESDLKHDFEVYDKRGGRDPFRVKKNGQVIAYIDMNIIRAENSFIKKVKSSPFTTSWMLDEDENYVITLSNWKLLMNNEEIGKLTTGGSIFHTIYTLITKGKLQWPDPFSKVEFDENGISAEAALCILLSQSVTSP